MLLCRTEDGSDVSQNFERALQSMGAKVSKWRFFFFFFFTVLNVFQLYVNRLEEPLVVSVDILQTKGFWLFNPVQ